MATQQGAAAKARKRTKKNVVEGVAHIHASFNNRYFHVHVIIFFNYRIETRFEFTDVL